MNDDRKPLSDPEMKALAKKAAEEVIARWRAEGLSDAEIEKKLGRPLPSELRR